jgi:hypothetical protein
MRVESGSGRHRYRASSSSGNLFRAQVWWSNGKLQLASTPDVSVPITSVTRHYRARYCPARQRYYAGYRARPLGCTCASLSR